MRLADIRNTEDPIKLRTVITFGLLFIVGLLQVLGVDLGLLLSPDAQWITIVIGFIGTILELITGQPIDIRLMRRRQDKI